MTNRVVGAQIHICVLSSLLEPPPVLVKQLHENSFPQVLVFYETDAMGKNWRRMSALTNRLILLWPMPFEG
jgi:hypothetical protein